MKQIPNQLRIVLLAVARLLWFVMRGAWGLLAAGAGYVYRHRVHIIQYKYTVSIVMALSVAWAGWRLYDHLQGPPAGDAVVYEAEVASAEAVDETPEHYAVFTSDTSEKTGNTALITSIYDWLGTPHRDGGTSKHGTDCSYFVQSVYQEAYGIELNRNSRAMYEEDVRAIRKETCGRVTSCFSTSTATAFRTWASTCATICSPTPPPPGASSSNPSPAPITRKTTPAAAGCGIRRFGN
jgi:hypothetical protein